MASSPENSCATPPKHWKKRFVDANVCPLSDTELKWADVVLLSGVLVHKQELLAILTRCRSRGLRTVIGGPACSPFSTDRLDRSARLIPRPAWVGSLFVSTYVQFLRHA